MSIKAPSGNRLSQLEMTYARRSARASLKAQREEKFQKHGVSAETATWTPRAGFFCGRRLFIACVTQIDQQPVGRAGFGPAMVLLLFSDEVLPPPINLILSRTVSSPGVGGSQLFFSSSCSPRTHGDDETDEGYILSS